MSGHPSRDELRRFLVGTLSGPRVIELARHLRSCPRCALEARTSEPAIRAGVALIGELSDDEEHPAVESALTRYVDGTLDAEELAPIEDHLFRCPRCREDVDDLRAMAAVVEQPRRRRSWPAIAAAAAAIAAVTILIGGQRAKPDHRASLATAGTPPPAIVLGPHYARAEWTAAVTTALRDGAIPMPAALAELRLDADPERGPAATIETRVEPSGAIVESTRPTFRWTSTPRTTWIVTLFDERGTVIADSGRLTRPSWQPDRDLRRGRVYQVQVRVTGVDHETIIPAPPAPPALFRVLDEAAHAELESARAAHGNDPLLLGVLYARHGLQADAIRALQRVQSAEAKRLLANIQTWDR